LASIIEGSAVGPVSYVINASDLSTVTPGKSVHKYADNTDSVILARPEKPSSDMSQSWLREII